MDCIKLEIEPSYNVTFYEHFYDATEADALAAEIQAIPMAHPRFMGREARRLTAQFGRKYDYSRSLRHGAEPEELHEKWPPLLSACKEFMEFIAGPLDGGLVQIYPDGRAGIGWHSDEGHPKAIASLSLGADRVFAMGIGSSAKACKEIWRITLTHGSVLVISGAVNDCYMHCLVVDKSIQDPRINVTLRRFPEGVK